MTRVGAARPGGGGGHGCPAGWVRPAGSAQTLMRPGGGRRLGSLRFHPAALLSFPAFFPADIIPFVMIQIDFLQALNF